MSNPKIVLYAEALTHIRQLTLHASLQTEKNEHTKILISSDKKIITALHDGEASSIYLPTQISGTAHVTFPFDRRTELSTRLQIDDTAPFDGSVVESEAVEVPWSAVDLQDHDSLYCGQCEATILPTGKITTWKDLPSENWAELMDFWFCHKPHDAHSEQETQAADAKGFSAKSKVATSAGTGLVDTVSFLLNGQDCTNIQETEKTPTKGPKALQCQSCGSRLGSYIVEEHSYRLYKSRIAIRRTDVRSLEKYQASVFLSAQLLSSINSSVTRKAVVHDGSGDQLGLLLWVFNPSIYYSSSQRGPTAHRAMKIFYKDQPNPGTFLDIEGSSFEELVVPSEDLESFKHTLQGSTKILPDSARKFQDWAVGLLDRWEKDATASQRMDENPLNHKLEEGFETFKLPAGMQELYL